MTDTRIADSVYTGYSQTKFGAMQAVIGLKCPYCETVTEAYAWSLAGVGKKCDCGAIHQSI